MHLDFQNCFASEKKLLAEFHETDFDIGVILERKIPPFIAK